jgi:hypothetical protein
MKRIVPLFLLTIACGASAAKESASPSVAPNAHGGMPGADPAPQAAGQMGAMPGQAPATRPDSVADYDDKRLALNEEPPAPPAEVPAPKPAGKDPGKSDIPPAGQVTKAPQGPKAAAQAHEKAMLVYTARLQMAVFQVEPGLDAVQKIAEDAGGYLATRTDNQIDIRVPREKFQEALKAIEKTGDVLHRTVQAEDVTDRYVDAESRLRNARAIRLRLQSLLERAPVKEALEIERELGRVTQEIEVLEGKLKLLRDQISFSTITVQYAPKEQSLQKMSFALPFPWLTTLGLGTLLRVSEVKGGSQ